MKMPWAVPEGHFEQFFAPLVGDEEHADDFRVRLEAGLDASGDDNPDDDPYASLEAGVIKAVRESATGHLSDDVKGRELSRWQSLEVNAELGGHLVVSGLRTLGNIYETDAKVPQKLPGVRQSTARVLSHIHAAAFTGKFVGFFNVAALGYGTNPRRPWTPVPVAEAAKPSKSVHRNSFTVETDEQGQLIIRPRYKYIGRILNRRCPATHARVERGGHPRSALFAFINTIGEVAVEKIFPEQFEIVEETSDPFES